MRWLPFTVMLEATAAAAGDTAANESKPAIAGTANITVRQRASRRAKNINEFIGIGCLVATSALTTPVADRFAPRGLLSAGLQAFAVPATRTPLRSRESLFTLLERHAWKP